jgi:hypothetical protein
VPDLTGIPALDVFIGMAFMFFLLSTVCSGVNEVIQTVLNARARNLIKGLKTLFKDPKEAEKFMTEWRIERLCQPAGFIRKIFNWLPKVPKRRRPSYIPARAFALTILETATPDVDPKVGVNLFKEAEATVEKLGIPAIAGPVSDELGHEQKKLIAVRTELEHTFDEAMDRASGWYKRYVQWWLVAIALVVSIGLNVDSFRVADRLWKDDALRASVVQQAQKAVDTEDAKTPTPTNPDNATPAVVAKQIDEIEQLKLPIGWAKANRTGSTWSRLAGWLVTAFALSLGAPFWFDVLGKAARLRNTGNREGTAKSDDRAPEDRDDPSGKRPATS